MQIVPSPSPLNSSSFEASNYPQKTPFELSQAGDLKAAAEARKIQVEGWQLLHFRQDFADETFMPNHIKAAGLRSPNRVEPTTVSRLRSMLTRAKVTGSEMAASVGTNLGGFLALNPLFLLWAALALVLESTGQSTRKAFDLGEEGTA